MGRSKLSNVVSTCDGFAHANFKLCHLVLEVTVECLGLISTTLGGLIGNFHFYYALASTLISIAKQYDLYGLRSDPICNWSSWTNGDGKKERIKKLKTRSKVQHEKKKNIACQTALCLLAYTFTRSYASLAVLLKQTYTFLNGPLSSSGLPFPATLAPKRAAKPI